MGTLFQDVRLAAQMLLKQPSFRHSASRGADPIVALRTE
jgi:hypothetical protein